jgi:monoamine oxidase
MSNKEPKRMSRREFVTKVGQFSGASFAALTAMGLLSRSRGEGAPLHDLPPVSGDRAAKVLILGAGVAGLAAAYELEKLGFTPLILEAAGKPGGRCITIRGGDEVVETNGHRQTCRFDEGQYFDPGPSRFPFWHITMDYCRELGVPVAPFVGQNENAFYLSDRGGSLSGQRVRIREAKTDLRGYTAELLAKVTNQGALDQEITPEDRERLLAFLRYEGGLSSDLVYNGHSRRGYTTWPGGGTNEGVVGQPHDRGDLLAAEFGLLFHRANEALYQTQMYAPVGGMDQIAQGFVRKVGRFIRTGAEVKEIRHGNPGVRVVYEMNGDTLEETADYCICTLPPPIMRRLRTDLTPQLRNVINVVPFQNSGKIGIQFKRRFWEEDDRIFGGVSWTTLPNAEVWYPHYDFFAKKGVVTGYYVFGPTSDGLGRMTPEQRLAFAMEHGEKMHPQYKEEFDNAVSFNWSTTPWIEGCLAHFPRAMIRTFYPFLIRPEREFYVASDWASHLGGWQAGSFESARLVVKDIHTRATA